MSTPISQGRPDAILVPHDNHSVAAGSTRGAAAAVPNLDKISLICDLVEPLLGGSRPSRTAFVRNQKHERQYFCSLDPTATLLHPAGSPNPGRPRYDWIAVDGLQHGYLRERDCDDENVPTRS
jgi:hypothetical protein